jgi:PIN domain nuclease of toxin-antitoxin system
MGGPARLKYLLDTHIWIWLLQDSPRLGRQTRQQLTNRENELWLSPMSTWEALTLNFKGKIKLGGDLAAWLSRATAATKEAPLTHEIALAARQLHMHQDPADRILAATAKLLDLILVTADEQLLGLGDVRTLANR